ncbi:MAG: single-stranded-DNA-specific exonuclease RecJ [Pseudomonadota bacterium]
MAIPAYRSQGHTGYQRGITRVFKRIRLRQNDAQRAQAIAAALNVSAVVGRVLAARGFEPGEDLNNYITPTLRNGIPDPAKLKNLQAAAKAIIGCHAAGKAIAICCDFDVDGLSGGSVVHDFFNTAGVKSKVFVPDRFVDGYGLNERVVREIAQAGFGMLLTIDFGTTNSKELTLAKELGLTTVVVDHHHMSGEPPPADVFINPHQKGCGFANGIACAAGLAWYLVLALTKEIKEHNQAISIDAKDYLELACLGTICDMVPLVGVNRVIAKRGLESLSVSKRPGLRALRNVIGIKGAVGCGDVSFGIGPRLNAAGRIVHGELVVELLTTRDSVRADKLARDLNELNAERQAIEGAVKQQAIEQIEQQVAGLQAQGKDSELWGLVAWHEEFHTGVIGIVAQRLVEHFYRPAAVMGMDSPGIWKGSVRGIRGFSVVEALAAVKEHLIKFGGHEGAGGFSVHEDHVGAFQEAFRAECKRRLESIEREPFVDVDAEAALEECTVQVVRELEGLAPFGMGNPTPVILLRDLLVKEVRVLKDAHLKVVLSNGKRFITGLLWRQTSHPALEVGKRVNIACKPDINTYGGNQELQATLQAVEELK